jgi:hypothetical protein
MRRRRFKRRLFLASVIFTLLLVYLALSVARPFVARRRDVTPDPAPQAA